MNLYNFLKPYILKNKKSFLLGFLSLLFVDALQLWIPRISKYIIDGLSDSSLDHWQIFRAAALILFFALLIGIFRFIWRYLLIGTSRKIERDLRKDFYSHVINMDYEFFDKNTAGDLMSRATNDIMNIRMAVGMGFVALTDAILLGGAAIAFMLWINPLLTLFALIPMPFIVFFVRFMGRHMHSNYAKVQKHLGEMSEMLREGLSGIELVRLFSMESFMEGRLRLISKLYLKKKMSLAYFTSLLAPLILLFANISLAILLGFGGKLVIENKISIGDFVAFIAYLGMLSWPMMALAWMTNLIQRGKASLERLFEIMEKKPLAKDKKDRKDIKKALVSLEKKLALKPLSGEISIKNLSFAFNKSGPEVLSDISLDIKAGMKLGIVGPAACGKSSLLKLIAGLYMPDSGDIFFDGINSRGIASSGYKKHLSYLSQRALVFSGSIRENIIGFEDDLNFQDKALIDSALKFSALDKSIALFPEGLDTLVGERGLNLSGGQKQRLALARVFFHKAPILLLDDPISQLDSLTANSILNNIKDLKSLTRIIVSQRFFFIEDSDLIIVMEKGRIKAMGDHDYLMKNNDYYARNWQLQAMEADF